VTNWSGSRVGDADAIGRPGAPSQAWGDAAESNPTGPTGSGSGFGAGAGSGAQRVTPLAGVGVEGAGVGGEGRASVASEGTVASSVRAATASTPEKGAESVMSGKATPVFRDHKAALEALYNARDVTKLRNVDDTLRKYAGREGELWVKLKKKYGDDAVPPTISPEGASVGQAPMGGPVIAASGGREEEEEEDVTTVGCFGTRESPQQRQQRMETEAAQKNESSIVRCMNAVFGGPVGPGEVPHQYPWLIVTYAGCHFWCLCCSYILLLYGIQFEESVGHLWFLTAMMSMVVDVFVNEPAMLFVTSVVLTTYNLYNRQNIRSMGIE